METIAKSQNITAVSPEKIKKTGILLINTGSPNSPSVKDVRRYLKEFLSDPRVVDLPTIIRWLLLNFFILPTRPPKTAAAYQSIWKDPLSPAPLLQNMQAMSTALQSKLGDTFHVQIGMRYGNPGISVALDTLAKNCDPIHVLPMFPQYASASTGSAIEVVLSNLRNYQNIPGLHLIPSFFEHPRFIATWANIIQKALYDTEADHVLFSYHGLPERQIAKSEKRDSPLCTNSILCPSIQSNNYYCYRAQCFATTNAIVEHLNLKKDSYTTSFQSRLGGTPWIGPYTDVVLPELIKKGVKHLAVACPSFVADCLETLEEIGLRAKEQWLALGGKKFTLVPCLNSTPEWIDTLATIILESK